MWLQARFFDPVLFFLLSYSARGAVTLRIGAWPIAINGSKKKTMDTNDRLARILTFAADSSGKPRCEIAGQVGIHKDTLLRVLRGDRPIAIEEAERILNVCGVPVHAAVLLTTTGQGELAQPWLRNDAGAFFESLLSELAPALDAALGERIADVRPRWARGTAQLIARALARHLAEFEERDLSIATPRAGEGELRRGPIRQGQMQ